MIRGGGLGISPPHLGCLWFSRQCRRSSQLQLLSPPWCLSQSLCFSTIVATATGVTSCSSSADCLLSGPLVLRVCLRRDVVWWWFYSWWCSRFYLGQRYADDWKFFIYLQYQAFFGFVCMLNYWFSSNDDICAANYNSRFKLKASVAVTSGRCIFPVLMTCTMRTLGASACSMVGSAAATGFALTTTTLPGSS